MTPFTKALDRSRQQKFEVAILCFVNELARRRTLNGVSTLERALMSAAHVRARRASGSFPLGFVESLNSYVVQTGRRYLGWGLLDRERWVDRPEEKACGDVGGRLLAHDEAVGLILAECSEPDVHGCSDMEVARAMANAALMRAPGWLQREMTELANQYNADLGKCWESAVERREQRKLN